MRTARFAIGLLGRVVLGIAGCATQPTKPSTPATTQPQLSADVAAHNAAQIEMATDPSAVRLQDIGMALQLYYRTYGGMPQTLQQAADLWKKKMGLDLVVTAPDSRPYVYVPQGLSAPNQPRRLVVYEAVAHEGWRWGVVMMPPPEGMTTVTSEVARLPDEIMKIYLQSAGKR